MDMDSICQKFLQAERDFLLAARSDSQLLVDFSERWQALHSEWKSYSQQVDRSTRELIDSIVANVEELAADLYVVESQSFSLEDDLLSGLEDALSLLSLEDPVVARAEPTSDERTETGESSSLNSTTISPAQWLLRNLHNPYPPPHIKFSTHRNANSKHVKDWFSKARQRIGWSRLVRDRFGRCRSLAIDAAFRAFIRDDPVNPLDSDLKTAFLAIKSHADLVYGNEDNNSYPSPKRPRSISPTPSLTFSSTSEDTDDQYSTLPPMTAFARPKKREFSGSSDSPSQKRIRVKPSPSPTLKVRAIPSPCAGTTPLRPRKRRLSESSHDGSRPKRPRGVEGVRNHGVSDPLPEVSPAWSDFDVPFQIPNPASTDPLELSSFDVDFFDPRSLPSCVVSSTFAPCIDIATHVSVDDFSTLFEIPQLDLSQQTLPTFSSDWTEFLNFDPDLPLFHSSPTLASSSANTPPLVDDDALSPSPPSDSDLSSPHFLLGVLPQSSDKGVLLPAVWEPIILEQDFLLPPGEGAGILSASALLSVH